VIQIKYSQYIIGIILKMFPVFYKNIIFRVGIQPNTVRARIEVI